MLTCFNFLITWEAQKCLNYFRNSDDKQINNIFRKVMIFYSKLAYERKQELHFRLQKSDLACKMFMFLTGDTCLKLHLKQTDYKSKNYF